MRRAALFVLVAITVYVALLAVMLAVTGEVSCDEVCSPASEFLNDAFPVPMIAGIAFSLGIAFLVVRPRRPR
jgi:hypothetical protein